MNRHDLAVTLYTDSGREISQQFDTMGTNVTLAGGTLAAVLALLGGGELFAARSTTSTGGITPATAPSLGLDAVPRLSSVSLVVLCLAFPFLVGFLMRSVTAYQNLLRSLTMQREALRYLRGETAFERLDSYIEIYLVRWRSPESLVSTMWHSMKYTRFPWVVVVAAGAITWAFITCSGLAPRLVAAGILLLGLGWEALSLPGTVSRYWTTPSEDERAELAHYPPRDSEDQAQPVSNTPTAHVEVLDMDLGVFIGRRRRLSRPPSPM